MEPCPRCGTRNPSTARFCATCGRPLAGGGDPVEIRKPVTVVFVDVVGSTALGERLDPEATRHLMARYFTIARDIVERHGGTVEKFIGDAVMAVFGIPTVHEDDALRAVRAAAAIPRALGDATIEVRIGIDSGEVIAGDPTSGEGFATGDTVNTAARIQQAAEPSEVLLSQATWRLVRDAVQTGPPRDVALRGKGAPLQVRPLLEVVAGAPAHARRFDAPLVGRERELRRLRQAFRDVVDQRRCELFTLLGLAGVGKSRLVAEFLETVAGEARVVRGRCLPYGEGITYWPIAEVVRAAARITEDDAAEVARQKLRTVVAEDAAATALGSAIGLSDEVVSRDEIFWAIRTMLEHLAAEQPLVVVFEDIHWAEPTFLDAVERVADLSRDRPILILCLARPELLESRSGWAGGKVNATTVLLEPLPVSDTNTLIGALPGGSVLPDALRERITDSAEGNPLFVEEMLRMLVDDGTLADAGGATWTLTRPVDTISVPASIQALLAARLDQLLPRDRTIASRASVVGRVFERDAIAELAPDDLRGQIADSLVSLVRTELIRPDRATLTAGDAYKFRHILIRDAAYESLPKLERARLHERFADWLERVAGDRLSEFEEIVGYHLEQTYRYREELDVRDDHSRAVAARAGRHLVTAGRDAWERNDLHAAHGLLSRATELLPADSSERWAARMIVGAIVAYTSDPLAGLSIVDEVLTATAKSDPALSAEARLRRLSIEGELYPRKAEGLRRSMAPTLRVLQRAGRWAACADVWRHAGVAHQNEVDVRRASAAYARMARYAERSGDLRTLIDAQLTRIALAVRDRTPVPIVLEMIDAVGRIGRLSRADVGSAQYHRGYLFGLEGRFAEARAALEDDRKMIVDLGLTMMDWRLTTGIIETFAQDYAAAERSFAAAYEEARVRAPNFLSFLAARRANALARMGRFDEVPAHLDEAALATGTEDRWTQVIAGGARARLLAWQGRGDAAIELAMAVRAVADDAGFDAFPALYGQCLEDVAAVLEATGRPEQALTMLATALEAYEAKGATALVANVRRMMEAAAGGAMPSP